LTSFIARRTASRVSELTGPMLLMTRETVAFEQPTARATSASVAFMMELLADVSYTTEM
jgi:hypothetical protein